MNFIVEQARKPVHKKLIENGATFQINQLSLPAADGGDEYNFVAVLEDGVGGDEFQVEAEAGAIAPLF